MFECENVDKNGGYLLVDMWTKFSSFPHFPTEHLFRKNQAFFRKNLISEHLKSEAFFSIFVPCSGSLHTSFFHI